MNGLAQRATSIILSAFVMLLMAATTQAVVNSVDDQVTAIINKQFNSGVETLTEFKPYHLVGDFNGDGNKDLLAVVQLKVERKQLPKDVRVVNPFGFRDINSPTESSSGEGQGAAFCLAVIHGGKQGWSADAPAAKFLLLGGSPILILNRANLTADGAPDLMSLIGVSRARRSKYSEYRIPQSARGDWVLVGTQVGEGLIYWDGKTYRFKDSPQD
jgi:hypothetical protein